MMMEMEQQQPNANVEGTQMESLLETRIQTIETEIHDLTESLQRKQTERDYLYKQLVGGNHGGGRGHKTREDDTALEAHSNNKLPQEILGLVFGNNLQNPKSLLNCRLVCKNWKLGVDNSPPIMRNLIFTIYDWRSFNESTIIDTVKSVRIFTSWNVDTNDKSWLEFAKRLGQTLEKIEFDFCDFYRDLQTIQQSTRITASLLSHCAGLKRLDILNSELLMSLAATWDLKVPVNIKELKLEMLDTDSDILEKIIFLFPMLETIEIKNADRGMKSALCKYMEKNRSLKKIIMEDSGDRYGSSWFKYLFTCVNRGIELKSMDSKIVLDVETFLPYDETPEAPVTEITCQYFNTAWSLVIKDGPMRTDRIGCCKNITVAFITFLRRGLFQELLFLRELNKLEYLSLRYSRSNQEQEGEDDHNGDAVFPCEVFAFGCQSLNTLRVNGDVFGRSAQAFASFYLYFPNLKDLDLTDLSFVPADIFVHLSKLEILQTINIDGDSEWDLWDPVQLVPLTNEMFTQLCQSQRPEEMEKLVPAITAFKNLKQLNISGCPLLTDICIVDGIALSQTLIDISLGGIRDQLTVASNQALENANFICKDDDELFFKRSF